MGSFTGCARELLVSQAAVSKRIHQLEEWIGEPLFIRKGKRLQATENGERLYQSVGMALEFLRQGLEDTRSNARRPLSIAASTVVGMFWLAPQLQAFGLSGDACPTRMTTADNTSALLAERSDLLLLYSDGVIPGYSSILLMEEELTPVASPELARKLNADPDAPFASLPVGQGTPILDYARGAPDWVGWRAWLQSLNLPGFGDWRVETMSTYSQTIGEALRGNGIALGSLALLKTELDAGRLVRLSSDLVRTCRGYYLCHDEQISLSGDAARLARYLLSAAGRNPDSFAAISAIRDDSPPRPR